MSEPQAVYLFKGKAVMVGDKKGHFRKDLLLGTREGETGRRSLDRSGS